MKKWFPVSEACERRCITWNVQARQFGPPTQARKIQASGMRAFAMAGTANARPAFRQRPGVFVAKKKYA
jgi:hypothetical protein